MNAYNKLAESRARDRGPTHSSGAEQRLNVNRPGFHLQQPPKSRPVKAGVPSAWTFICFPKAHGEKFTGKLRESPWCGNFRVRSRLRAGRWPTAPPAQAKAACKPSVCKDHSDRKPELSDWESEHYQGSSGAQGLVSPPDFTFLERASWLHSNTAPLRRVTVWLLYFAQKSLPQLWA